MDSIENEESPPRAWETSFTILNRILVGATAIKKLFWLVTLSACLLGLGYNLIWLGGKYFELRNVARLKSRSGRERLPFPSVTVCDLNPFRTSKLAETEELKILYESLKEMETRLKKRKSAPDQLDQKFQSDQTVQREKRANLIERIACFSWGGQGKSAEGGTQVDISPANVIQCGKACLQHLTCESFAFNSLSLKCTLKNRKEPVVHDSIAVYFYTRDSKDGVCDMSEPSTNDDTDTNENGGSVDPGPEEDPEHSGCFERIGVDKEPAGPTGTVKVGITVTECGKLCRKDPSCKVAIFYPEAERCTVKSVDPDAVNMVPSNGHAYSWKRTCFSQSDAVTTTTTTPEPPTTSTLDPTTTNDDITTPLPSSTAKMDEAPQSTQVVPQEDSSTGSESEAKNPAGASPTSSVRPQTILILQPKTEPDGPTTSTSFPDYYDKVVTEAASSTKDVFERLGLGFDSTTTPEHNLAKEKIDQLKQKLEKLKKKIAEALKGGNITKADAKKKIKAAKNQTKELINDLKKKKTTTVSLVPVSTGPSEKPADTTPAVPVKTQKGDSALTPASQLDNERSHNFEDAIDKILSQKKKATIPENEQKFVRQINNETYLVKATTVTQSKPSNPSTRMETHAQRPRLMSSTTAASTPAPHSRPTTRNEPLLATAKVSSGVHGITSESPLAKNEAESRKPSSPNRLATKLERETKVLLSRIEMSDPGDPRPASSSTSLNVQASLRMREIFQELGLP